MDFLTGWSFLFRSNDATATTWPQIWSLYPAQIHPKLWRDEQGLGTLGPNQIPSSQFPWVSARCLVEELIEDAIPIGQIQNLLANTTPAESVHVRRDYGSWISWILTNAPVGQFRPCRFAPGNILVTFVEMPRRIPPHGAWWIAGRFPSSCLEFAGQCGRWCRGLWPWYTTTQIHVIR